MNNLKYQKHMSLDDREIIEKGISSGLTKTTIAKKLHKDLSTVSKEIKSHRFSSYHSSLPLECANYKRCRYGRVCSKDCEGYKPFFCHRRDKSPGACNGCDNYTHCRFNKYKYDAKIANEQYLFSLKDSRIGANLTTKEAEKIAGVFKPLLEKGQSPYQILTNHPEITISESTFYNYVANEIFAPFDIFNFSLRRKIRYKMQKSKKNQYKKRQNKKYLVGREYKDFVNFLNENPNSLVLEMDTVYNDETNGPFIQTFTIRGTEFLFAFLHKKKTAETMISGIKKLDDLLGHEIFNKYFHCTLTDRGSEFTSPESFDIRNDGTKRTNLFYCDPMQSGQKGTLEKKHTMLRYLLPKNKDLYKLGLTSQEKLNLILSHINSTPVESLNKKTPFEYIEFMYPDLYNAIKKIGLKVIQPDEVTLTPNILKK